MRNLPHSIGMAVAWLAAATALVCRGDDVGDAAGLATPLSVNGAPANAQIEQDTDQDWFSFVAMPYASYTVSVATGTIWDCDMDFWTPDGASVLAGTSTVWSASSGAITWTNTLAGGTYFVRLRAFAEFTTGTYQVAVTGGGFVDSNGNGLPDAWELARFGNLTNTAAGDTDEDGLSNREEYLAGTHPADSGSGLFVSGLRRLDHAMEVAWPGVAYGAYRVSASTNLVSPDGWLVLGTNGVEASAGPRMRLDPSAAATHPRFYRIEYVY